MDQALMQRAQQVFRANAERHEAQSRHDATATAK
jgi:hypothetical protein